jgi:hypothetical protein
MNFRNFSVSTETNNNNTPLKKFIKGLKIGFNMPLLPNKVLKFHNNPFIRILRVVGGIFVIIWLAKLYGNYYILIFPIVKGNQEFSLLLFCSNILIIII